MTTEEQALRRAGFVPAGDTALSADGARPARGVWTRPGPPGPVRVIVLAGPRDVRLFLDGAHSTERYYRTVGAAIKCIDHHDQKTANR